MKAPRRGHVVQLDTDTHQSVQQLLPWLVAGRLDDSDRARIESHLAACPHCQAELDWERRLQALHASCAADDSEIGSDDASDAHWQALRQRVEAPWGRVWQGVWHRLRRMMVMARPSPSRWLSPLPVAALLALAVVPLGLWMQAALEPSYRTLSAPGGTSGADAIVMFDPAISEQSMRAALTAAGASVVGGPTPAGAWLLQLPPGDETAALLRLKSQPAVRLAEPLAPEGAPR